MKKFLMLVCALAIATSALAGQSKPKASYDGIVEKYDASTKTLMVKRKDKQGEFIITDTSEVLDAGKKADASALTVGRKVDLDFTMDGAKKMVQKIKVSGPAATK